MMSPRNQSAVRTAMNQYTRKTLPVGLAVTKVGPPKIPIQRPPVINRSMSSAKTPRVTNSNEDIDRRIPAAYKNPNWKYYIYLDKEHVLFKNTPNGEPYTINKKTGMRRTTDIARVLGRWNIEPQGLRWKARKTPKHTWQEYLKRLERSLRTHRGAWKRYDKKHQMNNNVKKYKEGNTSALNKWTLPNLVWWGKTEGHPFKYFKSYGKYYRHGQVDPITRKNILNNLHLFNSNV